MIWLWMLLIAVAALPVLAIVSAFVLFIHWHFTAEKENPHLH